MGSARYLEEWQVWLQAFEDAMRSENVADATVHAYHCDVSQLLGWVADEGVSVENIDQQVLARYVEYVTKGQHRLRWGRLGMYCAAAARRKLATLRRLIAFLGTQGLVKLSLGWTLKDPEAAAARSKRHGRRLRMATVRELLSHPDCTTPRGIRDRAILLLMAFTAVRAVEVRRALRGDLGQKGSKNILWVVGKGRVEPDEFVVVPGMAWDGMQAWLAIGHPGNDPSRPLFYSLKGGRPLSARGMIGIITRSFDRAGIHDPTKTGHSLRHTAITKADLGGADPIQLQAMARHRSFDTTLAYIHLARRLLDPAELRIRYEGLESAA